MAISAVMFSAPLLLVTATDNATLYQRNACSQINGSLNNAVELGTLATNQTQLNVGGQVLRANPENYYKFELDGDNLKMDFDNITNSSDLNIQLLDSSGTVVADNQGTTEQQEAYTNLTGWEGLTTDAGEYYVKVSFGVTSLKENAQTYSLSLYSGTQFSKSYQTTSVPQTSLSQKVVIDTTLTFATSDATYYSNQLYHRVNETVSDALNMGWLYENKGALYASSKVTNTDANQYYSFTLQKGSALKMAFTNATDTTDLRYQITDSTGISVFADNYGTEAQREAFEQLQTSDGLKAKPGQYAVKVTYAPNADRTKSQNYNFYVYSGETYSKLYKTSASAETYDTAYLNGTLLTGNYNAASAAATYLYDLSQGVETDIFDTLSSLVV